MKSLKVLVALTGILFLITACNPFDRSGRSFMNISFPGNEQRVIIHSENMSLDIKFSGDIVFNDEETAIEKISPGGYLDYNMNNKRLIAEPGPGGDVVYKFYNDDDNQVGEGSGKKFLVEAISEMISQGLFIKGRMERLYQQGGVSLLLSEVKRTKADHVKRQYLEFILKSDSISNDEMIVISNTIAKTMGSDDDKRKVLEQVPSEYLKDSLTADTYFAAIQSINSDNDKADALKHKLTQPLTVPGFNFLLRAAVTIDSDNDKANLIKDIVKSQEISVENYDSILSVIKTVNSDNDKANALKILIDKQLYPGETFTRLLATITKINSDNDKANVFRKLIEQNIKTEEQWTGLINETTSITSDNDKANVLLAASKKMPRTEAVIAAYMKASKTINSDSDYKRTVRPVI